MSINQVKKRPRLERHWPDVWCEFHGCIHAANRDPYGDGPPVSEKTPLIHCGPWEWRKIWIGGRAEKTVEVDPT